MNKMYYGINRSELPNETILKNSGLGEIEIIECVDSGSTSIVYLGLKKKDNTSVIIREFFPKEYATRILVDESKSIKIVDTEAFEKKKAEFEESKKIQIEFNKTHGLINSTTTVFESFEENNTVYYVEDYIDADNFANQPATSLSSALYATLLLAELIQKYHQNGYLYVDLSPKNFIYIEEGSATSIKLFDFDTVQKKEEIQKKGRIIGCTCNQKERKDYYAAPEVVNCINGNASIKEVDEKSDIYCIGAILFNKIMKRIPESTIDGVMNPRWSYKDNTLIEDIHPSIKKSLTKIFKKTLRTNKDERWAIEDLISHLKDAIEICESKEWIEDQNIRVTTEYFIERKDKEKEIKKALAENNIVFICGVSGYGKSELARSYCENNRNRYSTINLVSFDKNLKKTIADISVVSDLQRERRDEKEYDEDYKANLQLITKLGSELLLVIDNANDDLLSKENIEVLAELCLKKAHIIITTQQYLTEVLPNNCYQIEIDELSKDRF